MEPVQSETSSPVLSCPDCRVEMERGFEKHYVVDGRQQIFWERGQPRRTWFGILSTLGKEIPITAWHCPQCGLNRQYAMPSDAKNWRKVK